MEISYKQTNNFKIISFVNYGLVIDKKGINANIFLTYVINLYEIVCAIHAPKTSIIFG